MNDLAKTKIYAGVAVMAISGVLFALKMGDAAQTMAVVGSALLVGLGLNSAGHAVGQALAQANAPAPNDDKSGGSAK